MAIVNDDQIDKILRETITQIQSLAADSANENAAEVIRMMRLLVNKETPMFMPACLRCPLYLACLEGVDPGSACRCLPFGSGHGCLGPGFRDRAELGTALAEMPGDRALIFTYGPPGDRGRVGDRAVRDNEG